MGDMLLNGLNNNNKDMLKVAEVNLRKNSRRGGSAREEVANILTKVHVAPLWDLQTGRNEALISLAAEFVEVYANHYEKIVNAVFNNDTCTISCRNEEDGLAACALFGKWFKR